MEFLVRFCQSHESFRLRELEALATLGGIALHVKEYRRDWPFCIVVLPSAEDAKRLVERAILVQAIYEYWGSAKTMEGLRDLLKSQGKHLRSELQHCSFLFDFDSFQGSRSQADRLAIINAFSFLGFKGKVTAKQPEQLYCILEEWEWPEKTQDEPLQVHFGRRVGVGARDLAVKYSLKKRRYISTTSMDSELALVAANMVLADKGKIFYDPFVGTGSFPIACAHFGALAFGSDIDGRSARGYTKERSIRGNFEQYGLLDQLGSLFAADLTNTPIHVATKARLLDGILCDPPYGVREGLKVLGTRDPEKRPNTQGQQLWKEPNFVPPKKPYSFVAMLDDILAFAAQTLVDHGRLAFWMPEANDEADEISMPTHPCLQVVAISRQEFNKWSRKLITYTRLPDHLVQTASERGESKTMSPVVGTTADELNPFRRRYFTGFEP